MRDPTPVSAEAVIDALVENATREEKLKLVHGAYDEHTRAAAGHIPPIDRLDIPQLTLVDGPLGVRSGEATAFPAALALGATFDTALANRFGTALGHEVQSASADVVLAPGCNLVRTPHNGRTFEYFSEDPHHSGQLTAATVRGIQATGAAATVKHYIANNQETDRTTMSVDIDEQTLRELYLPAFADAVDADVAAVMAAYNQVNDTPVTEHDTLLTDILKTELGFDGPVMSDWYAVTDGAAAARAGTDLEMPGVSALELICMMSPRLRVLLTVQNYWPSMVPGPEEAVRVLFSRAAGDGGLPAPYNGSRFADELPTALATEAVSAARLDEMVRRVLRLYARAGCFQQQPPAPHARTELSQTTRESLTDRHHALAREIAAQGTVLLQNDADTLPLSTDTAVAVIGPNIDTTKLGGGGSSEVTPTRTVSPREGITRRADGPVQAAYGHPPIESVSFFDVVPDWSLFSGGRDGETIAAAKRAAKNVDVAIVVVQDDATEGKDRDSLALPGDQDRLIQAVAETAPRTVVVVQSGGPVELPWLETVDATLVTWYPGQAAGDALADVLYGDADPGGRLPVTFGQAHQYPTAPREHHPGLQTPAGHRVAEYNEGVYVGYRHFDTAGIEPTVPFGHGTSYASFAYNDASINAVSFDEVPGVGAPVDSDTPPIGPRPAPVTVTVTVENTADRGGKEVVQVYVRKEHDSIPVPVRELGGVAATTMQSNESRTVEIPLDWRAFANYSERDGWVFEAAAGSLEIGRSSRDIQTTLRFDTPLS